MLEGSDGPEGFLHIASHLLVVDGNWPHYSLAVDNEQSSEGGSIESIFIVLH